MKNVLKNFFQGALDGFALYAVSGGAFPVTPESVQVYEELMKKNAEHRKQHAPQPPKNGQ